MKLYLKAASVLALSLPMMAFAEDCVPELDDHCPAGVDVDRYCVVSIDAVSCPASGLKRSNPILLTSPPAQSITSATCNYTGGGYTCTAWPYSTKVSYSWTKFGNVSWVGSSTGDTVSVTCSPGMNNRVTLKVAAPNDPNAYSADTVYLYCGYMGEY